MVDKMLEAVPKGKRRLTGFIYALVAISLPELIHAVAAVVEKNGTGGLSANAATAIVGVSVAYFVSKFGEKSPG